MRIFTQQEVLIDLDPSSFQLLNLFYEGNGTLTELQFRDGEKLKLEPALNAGTVAVMYFFSRTHSLNEWLRIMDQTSGFASFYQNMFGDSWGRADRMGSLFPPGFSQPELNLPFEMDSPWAFTGGPHSAWEPDGPLAALDFAPAAAGPDAMPRPPGSWLRRRGWWSAPGMALSLSTSTATARSRPAGTLCTCMLPARTGLPRASGS